MYPYKAVPINPDSLIDAIVASRDGDKIFIDDNTRITIEKIKEPSDLEPDQEPTEEGRAAISITPPGDNKTRKCDNPKCRWADELFNPKEMTDFAGKRFCTLDCCMEYKGEEESQNYHHAKDTDIRWSKKYDACVNCEKTDHRHIARGLCRKCYFSGYNPKYQGNKLIPLE